MPALTISKPKVCRNLCGLAVGTRLHTPDKEILEENDWPGRYIPIIPVLGDEIIQTGG